MTVLPPPGPPPISPAYVPDGLFRWRNQISGDLVTWNAQRQCYERWNPVNGAKYYWGPTRDHTQAWHLYPGKPQLVYFWACTVAGFIFMIIAGLSGYLGVGIAIWGFMSMCGIGWMWLHARHPVAANIITVIGSLWAIGSLMGHRRKHIPW